MCIKKVIRDDYTFYIDIEKKQCIYTDAPRVFGGHSEYLPELINFLASLGIDIEKPVVYNLNDTYDLLYMAFGNFNTKTGYKLDFYSEDKYVSVVIFENKTKYKQSTPANVINLEVFGIAMKKK